MDVVDCPEPTSPVFELKVGLRLSEHLRAPRGFQWFSSDMYGSSWVFSPVTLQTE